ncbi:hypothetical protein MJO28_012889 [Puccinia striiformis f. sp. tritici]|uniref:Uncharacterized protein n=1 Tax=Puccinia striiformis f. sp. tritici TaxID=168172 RepID=A0ACC0DYT3_9BASI|nr:hypothetical protein MJO28_012889 [Puccinia striiformis f. sp. tritici]
MLQVNVLQPNLCFSLQRQLWELFLPSLVSKNLVESLAQDFLPHANLNHKKNLSFFWGKTLDDSENNNTDDVSSNLPTANDPHTSLVPASDIPLPKTPTSCLTRSAALATQSGALAPLLYGGLMPDEHLEVLLAPAELTVFFRYCSGPRSC